MDIIAGTDLHCQGCLDLDLPGGYFALASFQHSSIAWIAISHGFPWICLDCLDELTHIIPRVHWYTITHISSHTHISARDAALVDVRALHRGATESGSHADRSCV